MNRSLKSFRTLALGIVLVLGAALGSAATVSKALRAALPKVSGFRKLPPAGVRPFQSFACTTLATGCNTTVNGELTMDDCRLPSDQSFYDAWTFQATVGQTVQITMTSTTFDTFLFLFDPSGLELDENDDYPGGGSNSRISYTIAASGTYTIYANSYSTGITGAYSLEVLCAQSPSSGLVTLPAAASLHGAPPTFFHSDVSVFNPSATQPASVTARYRCFTGACGNATQTFTVPPRQLRVFEDIVGTLFLTSLSFSANLSTGFRTNVGVYNGNDVAQTVTFTLFNPQGIQIGQTAQLVPARTPLQINNIASFVGITADVPSFYCVVRGDGVNKNYAYAAVLDNQSQDLIFVKGAQSQTP